MVIIAGIFYYGGYIEQLLACIHGPVTGRYIIVQIRGQTFLHLTGLEVYSGKHQYLLLETLHKSMLTVLHSIVIKECGLNSPNKMFVIYENV
jgi:hypothetical protein